MVDHVSYIPFVIKSMHKHSSVKWGGQVLRFYSYSYYVYVVFMRQKHNGLSSPSSFLDGTNRISINRGCIPQQNGSTKRWVIVMIIIIMHLIILNSIFTRLMSLVWCEEEMGGGTRDFGDQLYTDSRVWNTDKEQGIMGSCSKLRENNLRFRYWCIED